MSGLRRMSDLAGAKVVRDMALSVATTTSKVACSGRFTDGGPISE